MYIVWISWLQTTLLIIASITSKHSYESLALNSFFDTETLQLKYTSSLESWRSLFCRYWNCLHDSGTTGKRLDNYSYYLRYSYFCLLLEEAEKRSVPPFTYGIDELCLCLPGSCLDPVSLCPFAHPFLQYIALKCTHILMKCLF